MIIKYNTEIKKETIQKNLKRILNQSYKLLPTREEGNDWKTPLTTIVEELAGMDRLLIDQQTIFFTLLCKMEGLLTLTNDNDFFLFRRILFECLELITKIEQCL